MAIFAENESCGLAFGEECQAEVGPFRNVGQSSGEAASSHREEGQNSGETDSPNREDGQTSGETDFPQREDGQNSGEADSPQREDEQNSDASHGNEAIQVGKPDTSTVGVSLCINSGLFTADTELKEEAEAKNDNVFQEIQTLFEKVRSVNYDSERKEEAHNFEYYDSGRKEENDESYGKGNQEILEGRHRKQEVENNVWQQGFMFSRIQRRMEMETELSRQNGDGDTILHVAIIFNMLSLVWQVLQQKLDISVYNIKNHLQQTPLHLAVITKQPLVARKLVVRGARLDAQDGHGNTPLHIACKSGDLHLVRALTMPITSRELKELDMTEQIQDTGADASILNYYGDSALHLAAAQGHITILRYLLLGYVKADVNVPDGRSGRTILHHAVESRNTLVLVFLIQNRIPLGLDIEAETYSGHSALELAESRKHYDVVRLLHLIGAGTHCDSRASELD